MRIFKDISKLLPLIVLLPLISCRGDGGYNDGYQEGYESGYVAGSIKGNEEGYELGLKKGYGRGYADASNKKYKDVMTLDTSLKKAVGNSRKYFSIIFFGINVLVLGGLLVHLVVIKNEDLQIRIAKIAYLLMSTAVAYLSISAFNVSNLVYPELRSSAEWFIIIAIAPLTFALSMIIRKLVIKVHVVYSDILAIFFSTFVLTYFVFFLLNLRLFLLHNELISYSVISMSAGGLAFAGYTIIEATYRTIK